MGFNPVLWLATYLKKYAASPSLCPLTPSSFNPNVPPRFTFIQAVVYLQARVRSYLVWSPRFKPPVSCRQARKELKRRKAEQVRKREQEEQACIV